MTGTIIAAKFQKAFTLIELLVVIAIISLLVSILLPSLTKAREYAKFVTCQTNLRGIGMGVHLYTEDWNGDFPLRNTSGVTSYAPYSLRPYLDLENVDIIRVECIFWCPTAPTTLFYSTGYNPGLAYYQIDNIKIPSEMVSYSDNRICYSNTGFGAILDNPDFQEGQTRHNDGANYIFLDQHAEWFLPEDILYTANSYAGDPLGNRRYWKPTYQ